MTDPKTPRSAPDPSPEQRDAARRKAQSHFSAYDERTAMVKEMQAKENAASDAKTAKLRALRLARDAETAAQTAADPDKADKKKTTRKKKVIRV